MDISKAELEVMKVIWAGSPCSANEIVDRLNLDDQQWHEKTVKTLLTRLVKKNALSYEKEQRRYLYFPLIAQADYQQKESESFVKRLFNGRVSPLIAGFAKQQKLSDEDVKELKQLISDWEKRND